MAPLLDIPQISFSRNICFSRNGNLSATNVSAENVSAKVGIFQQKFFQQISAETFECFSRTPAS
jgi:hypothetical protein